MADPQAPAVQLDMSQSVPLQAPSQGGQGLQLDMSKSVPIQQPSTIQNVMQGGKNIAKGFLEGAGQTGQSMVNATDYVGNKIGDALGLPGHASVQDMAGTGPAGQGAAIMGDLTTPTTTGEKIGVGAETIAEFIAGDEALKGLSLGEKALKAAKLAETYEKAGPLAKAAISAVMNGARNTVVGTASGLAHGETAAQASEQGLMSGVLAGGGEIAGELSGALKNSEIAKRLVSPAYQDASKALKAAQDAMTAAEGEGFEHLPKLEQSLEEHSDVWNGASENISKLAQTVGTAAVKQLPKAAVAGAASYAWKKIADAYQLPEAVRELGYVALGYSGLHSLNLGPEGTTALRNLKIIGLGVGEKALPEVGRFAAAATPALQPTVPTPAPEEPQQ